jgi:hypothetical protein
VSGQLLSEVYHRLIFQCCVGPDSVYQVGLGRGEGVLMGGCKACQVPGVGGVGCTKTDALGTMSYYPTCGSQLVDLCTQSQPGT